MKKALVLILAMSLILGTIVGCAGNSAARENGGSPAVNPPAAQTETQPEAQPAAQPAAPTVDFNTSREITIVSRESGSGTRSAFVELTGVEVSVDGTSTDKTSPEAVIGNGTNAIMTNVAGDLYAIGYISTGSVDDSIKTISIDGVEPTPANILAENYKIARPFIIVTLDSLDDAAEDFIAFIMSKEGQQVVADRYIPVDENAPAFQTNSASGTVVVGGSTSVAPIMESLAEAYQAVNTAVKIEIHATGSGAGITGTIDGVVDIGMSSRNIRDTEMESLHQQITIAMDGIAIIVNNDNPLTNLTMEEVREIYVGEKTRWSEVQ